MRLFRFKSNQRGNEDVETARLADKVNPKEESNYLLTLELEELINTEIYNHFINLAHSRSRYENPLTETVETIPNGKKTFFMVVAPENGYVYNGVLAPVANKANFYSSKYRDVLIEPDELTIGLYERHDQAEEARLNLMECFRNEGININMKYQPIDLQTACNVAGSFGTHLSIQFPDKRVLVPYECYRNSITTIGELEQQLIDVSQSAQIFSEQTGLNIVDADLIYRCLAPLEQVFHYSLRLSEKQDTVDKQVLNISISEKNIPVSLCRRGNLESLREELQYQICGVESQISDVVFSLPDGTSISEKPFTSVDVRGRGL